MSENIAIPSRHTGPPVCYNGVRILVLPFGFKLTVNGTIEVAYTTFLSFVELSTFDVPPLPQVTLVKAQPKSLANSKYSQVSKAVSTCGLFKNLHSTQLDQILNCMTLRSVPKDTVIFRQGDTANEMYVVDCGKVEVLRNSQVIAILEAGDVFGEIALLYNCTRTATIRTQGHVRLWVLDKSSFCRIFRVKEGHNKGDGGQTQDTFVYCTFSS